MKNYLYKKLEIHGQKTKTVIYYISKKQSWGYFFSDSDRLDGRKNEAKAIFKDPIAMHRAIVNGCELDLKGFYDVVGAK